MTITPIITYVMKATINAPPYTKITWKVYNAADMTGAQSGYDPSTLIDIVVDYTIINKAAVEQATPVVFQPGGVAGGDLGGTYPDPDVLKIHGYAVASTAPANQQVLIWNSTTQQYEPGAQLSGPPSGVAGGDLGGTYPNPIVSGIDSAHLTNHNSTDDVLVSTSFSNIRWDKLTNNNIAVGAGITYPKLNLVGSIVNADINASAAIAGSKINPNFGSQVLTAGQVTLGSTSSINSLIGSVAFNSRTISTSDTIDVFQKDFEILVDTSGGVVSLTLPTPTNGRFLIIKDKKQTFATNNLTLVRSGSEKIDGVAASLVLDVNNKELIVTSDGTDWYTNNTSATPTGPAGGDLTGTYPNPIVSTSNGNTIITNATSAGGDLSGFYPNPSVIKLRGKDLHTTLGSISTPEDGYVLTWDGIDGYWHALPTAGVITWASDLATSTNTNQYVVSLTGSSNTVDVIAKTLSWDVATSLPVITQAQSSGGANQFTIQAQKAGNASGDGGVLWLQGGDSPTGNGGNVFIKGGSGGTSYVNISGNVEFSSMGTGIIHADSSGILSSSLIVNADVSGSAAIAYSKLNLANSIVNADINSSAAIAYSKLNLTDLIVNADINASAAIAYSKLNLSNSIINTDVNSSAAIAYSKLNLTGSIINADINASAAIAYSKLSLSNSIVNTDINSAAAIAYSKLNLSGSIVNADINASAAIAYSKLNLTGSIVNADINASAAIAVSKLAAGTAGQVLLNNSTPTPTWTTLSGDVTVSSSGVTTVAAISGSTPIAITPAELQWVSGTTSPKLDQASTSAASGTTLTVQAQGATGATHNGGDLVLAGGTSGSATAGTVIVKTGGSTRLTAGATGVITIANLSTGVVHADSSGNLTSSAIVNADVDAAAAIAYSKLNLTGSIVNADVNTSAAIAYSKLNLSGSIVNADVSSSAAIAVSKLAAGTAGQILMNNATPTPTWTTLSSDITLGNTGVVTVVKLQGRTVASTAPTDTYVLTWNAGANQWEPQAGSGGGGVTWANDLSSSSSTHQYVSGLSGASGTAGVITMGDGTNELDFEGVTPPTNTNANKLFFIASPGGPASTHDGLNGGQLNIEAGQGSDGNGTDKNGGLGGDLNLFAGPGGAATGAGVAGSMGNISLTAKTIGITSSNIDYQASVTSPVLDQLAQGSTSGASGSNGQNMSITAQAGQAATGASHNGGNGGNLVLAGGAGGTSGSATAGKSGYVKFTTGTVFPTATKTSAYTLTYADRHIFANPSSGFNLTLPAPVNGLTFEIWDISGTAETNNLTLVRNGSEKISGVAASRVLSTNWGHWTVTTDGTDWFVG